MVRFPRRVHCGCAILPPQMLRRIAARGTARQRDAALETLATDQTMRLARATYELLEARSQRGLLSVSDGREAAHRLRCAAITETLPGIDRARRRGRRRSPTSRRTRRTTASARRSISSPTSTTAIRSTTRACTSTPPSTTAPLRQRVLERPADGLRRRRRRLFNRFTVSLDVIAHELTHGVTGDEAALVYLGQAGALNESMSDVFGSLVKQYARKRDGRQGGLADRRRTLHVQRERRRPAFDEGTGHRLRRSRPRQRPAAGDMAGYVQTSDDNGGVHINSGIPNHAFYLAAIALGGHAWEKAGRIWYETLRDKRLKPTATFAQFARYTVVNAAHFFGKAERQAVAGAWEAPSASRPVEARDAGAIAVARWSPMRIDFRMDGGIAAFPGLAKPVSIDCEALPPAETARLRDARPARRNFFRIAREKKRAARARRARATRLPSTTAANAGRSRSPSPSPTTHYAISSPSFVRMRMRYGVGVEPEGTPRSQRHCVEAGCAAGHGRRGRLRCAGPRGVRRHAAERSGRCRQADWTSSSTT